MNTYKVTLSIQGNPNFVCNIGAATKQRALILATSRAKIKLGKSIRVFASNADLIEG